MNRQQKRKRILVHKFQYQLVAVNLVYFLTIFLIFAAVLFVPLMIEMDSSSTSGYQTKSFGILPTTPSSLPRRVK